MGGAQEDLCILQRRTGGTLAAMDFLVEALNYNPVQFKNVVFLDLIMLLNSQFDYFHVLNQ
jgi:hypothetical protein